MKLYTTPQYQKLVKNGSPKNRDQDHFPVIKLFLPGRNCTWLISELDPQQPNVAFGLCDLGIGFPELGYVDLQEITAVKNRFGLSVERDLCFDPKYRLSVYERAARHYEAIVECDSILKQFV